MSGDYEKPPLTGDLVDYAVSDIDALKQNVIKAINQAFRDYYLNAADPHKMCPGRGAALAPFFENIIQPLRLDPTGGFWSRSWFKSSDRCTFGSVRFIWPMAESDNTLADLITRYRAIVDACDREARKTSKFGLLLKERIAPLITAEAMMAALSSSQIALNAVRAEESLEPEPTAHTPRAARETHEPSMALVPAGAGAGFSGYPGQAYPASPPGGFYQPQQYPQPYQAPYPIGMGMPTWQAGSPVMMMSPGHPGMGIGPYPTTPPAHHTFLIQTAGITDSAALASRPTGRQLPRNGGGNPGRAAVVHTDAYARATGATVRREGSSHSLGASYRD